MESQLVISDKRFFLSYEKKQFPGWCEYLTEKEWNAVQFHFLPFLSIDKKILFCYCENSEIPIAYVEYVDVGDIRYFTNMETKEELESLSCASYLLSYLTDNDRKAFAFCVQRRAVTAFIQSGFSIKLTPSNSDDILVVKNITLDDLRTINFFVEDYLLDNFDWDDEEKRMYILYEWNSVKEHWNGDSH